MAEFMVHHTHQAGDCERIFGELQSVDQSLKGKNFFCTCPTGAHGGFFEVRAADRDEALNLFPPAIRASAQIYAGETMKTPS